MTEVSGLSDHTSRWIVINTHSHKEALALDNLQRQKFKAYCPLIRRRIRHARRQQDVLRPLFPSYVFARVNTSKDRWQSISSTFGVKSFISFGGRVSFLQDDFISSLMAREVEGVIVHPVSPYQVGQQVRVSGGVFDGLIATIIDMNEKDRLVVLMDLLNRPVKVKLDAQNVVTA